MNVKCLKCEELNDVEDTPWKIGVFAGMKTKTFHCKKCKQFNNYSIGVGNIVKNPLLKAIFGMGKNETSKN